MTDIDKKDHATNLFSREAIEVIDRHAAAAGEEGGGGGGEGEGGGEMDPLFMYLSYSAPHDPLQADKEYLDKCADIPNRSVPSTHPSTHPLLLHPSLSSIFLYPTHPPTHSNP